MKRFLTILVVVASIIVLASSCNTYVCPAYVQDNLEEVENDNS